MANEIISKMLLDYLIEIGVIFLLILAEIVRRKLLHIKNNAKLPKKLREQSQKIADNLAILTGQTDADRVQLNYYNDSKTKFSCTHEITKPGIQSFLDKRKMINIEKYQPFIDKMVSDRYVVFNNIDDINFDELRSTLSAKGVVTLIIYEIRKNSNRLGFISLEYIRAIDLNPIEEVIEFLKETADILSSLITD